MCPVGGVFIVLASPSSVRWPADGRLTRRPTRAVPAAAYGSWSCLALLATSDRGTLPSGPAGGRTVLERRSSRRWRRLLFAVLRRVVDALVFAKYFALTLAVCNTPASHNLRYFPCFPGHLLVGSSVWQLDFARELYACWDALGGGGSGV